MLREPAPADFLATTRDYSPLIATLLYQAGVRDRKEVEAFFSSDYRTGLHDPLLLKGMPEASARIAAAIRDHEPIAVYGDFDTDGVTAVTLLMQAISAMGGEIQPYIPNRTREGYGLNVEAVERLAAEGVRVLITVDCGISNAREVAHARSLDLDVIVTDHHTPPETLPDATAVVNPKQPGCAYPYKQLVGVGIAYKLVQALVRNGVRMPLRGRDLLDVVALGTVADMGPLTGENRVLVKAGLEAINTTQRPGLRALIAAAGVAQGKINSGDIGFSLGPRLNAAGRLEDAVLSYQLLLADDFEAAQKLAAEINQLNRRRQELSRDVQEKARSEIETRGKHTERIIVLAGEDYSAGVVGLVAAKLVEEFGRPTLLIERSGDMARGSARSVPGFSIIEALTECADLFVRHGGHSAAAGFTIASDRIDELEARLLAYAADRLPDEMLEPRIEINADVPLHEISWGLQEQLAQLEPFGQANPQPVFMSRRVRVAGARTAGADGQHLKLRLDDGNGSGPLDAIGFRLGHLSGHFARHPWIDIAYTLEVNEWNGNRGLQLNIKDLRRAQP
jgi:single-stranded-DNA-specific exonuclease